MSQDTPRRPPANAKNGTLAEVSAQFSYGTIDTSAAQHICTAFVWYDRNKFSAEQAENTRPVQSWDDEELQVKPYQASPYHILHLKKAYHMRHLRDSVQRTAFEGVIAIFGI